MARKDGKVGPTRSPGTFPSPTRRILRGECKARSTDNATPQPRSRLRPFLARPEIQTDTTGETFSRSVEVTADALGNVNATVLAMPVWARGIVGANLD